MAEVLTERQNADRVFGRAEGDPQWVPVVGVYNDLIFSSGLHERPSEPAGKDWAGCDWAFDEKCLGYAPDLTKPSVLEDITEWREVVPFPDLDAVDWEACAEKDLADYDRENKYLCMFMETGPLERVNALMGMEETMVSFYTEPDEMKALLNAITDYKCEAIRKLGKYYKPDQFFSQDDLGSAKGPLISMDMYREFLAPCHKRIAEAIHEVGAIYVHHSCGWMDAFAGDLFELGADSLNPLQPMNDWDGLVERYGETGHFDVGVDSTGNPANTPEDVIAEVHKIIDTFGPTKHLTTMCFPTNVDAIHLVEVANEELVKYGHEFYAK